MQIYNANVHSVISKAIANIFVFQRKIYMKIGHKHRKYLAKTILILNAINKYNLVIKLTINSILQCFPHRLN